MENIRLILDITKRNANVLFDKETGKRMTFRNPLVVVPFISESMKRSIKAGKVIDVDCVSGIEVNPNLCVNHDRIMKLMGVTKVSKSTKSEEVKPVELEKEEVKPVEEKKEEVKSSKSKAKAKKEVKEEAKEEKVEKQ